MTSRIGRTMCAALALSCSAGFAEFGLGEEVVPTFHASVEKMAIARGEISAYDVSISATVEELEAPRPVGKEVGRSRQLVEYRGRIAMDGLDRRLHVARLDVLINRDDGEISDDSDNINWRVYVETEELQIIGSHGKVSIRELGIEQPFLLPRLFDPLSLGAAFVGDMAQRASVEKVLGNYLQWPQMPGEWEEDGVLRYALRSGGFVMRIDTKRGFWPIHVESISADNEVESATRLELEKIGDHWLPVKAVIRGPSEETTMKLNWKSVNEPLDDGLFDVNRVAKQYGLSVSDQRGFRRAD